MPDEAILHYEGTSEIAYDLVKQLEDEGLTIQWVPPPEERTAILEPIAISIIAKGSYDLLTIVVTEMRRRFGKKIKIEIERNQRNADSESNDQ
jgi:hypothetical protein